MKRTNRVAWGLAAVLAVPVLGGTGLLGVRSRPYWVAKHRGRNAPLFRAVLRGAHLEGANLEGADLRGSDLRAADLRRTRLGWTCLQGADLRGADLRGTDLRDSFFAGLDVQDAYQGEGPDFPREDLRTACFVGARYDARTRWPEGFDPARHGAVKAR